MLLRSRLLSAAIPFWDEQEERDQHNYSLEGLGLELKVQQSSLPVWLHNIYSED